MMMSISMEPIRESSLPEAAGPYSPGIGWEKLVFVSGPLAINPNGGTISADIGEQSVVILRNLKNILVAVGNSLAMVLSATVYLADLGDLEAFNEVFDKFFEKPYPARASGELLSPSPSNSSFRKSSSRNSTNGQEGQ
jgi:2-iminobutanoate/2-iminopropanoate deaminase